MLNLIRMDLYRLIHSKSAKVGLIAAAACAVAGMLLSIGIIEIFNFASSEDPELAMGMSSIFPMLAWSTNADFAEIVFFGSGTVSLFVACLVCASFIGSEQACGYIKNIAGQLPNKGYTVISKYVVTCIVQTVVFFIFVFASCLFTPFFDVTTYSIGTLIGALVLRLLLFFAMNAIIVFICTMTKSHAIAMVVGAVFGMGVTKAGYLAINALFGAMKLDFDVFNITPDGVNSRLAIDTLSENWPQALAVSIIYIVVFVSAAVIIVRKRDVR